MPVRIYGTSIYCRASREDGDKLESNTIASQRSICEDYIASHSDLVLIDEPYFIEATVIIGLNQQSLEIQGVAPV